MGVLPVDMMKPIPQEPKPQEKPKPNENEIFHVPEKTSVADDTNEIKPPQTQTEIENQPIPQVKAKKPVHFAELNEKKKKKKPNE